jgi:integrase
MSAPKTKRRVRAERGIYKTAAGSFEIGWTDASGKQRWRIVNGGGLAAARAALAEEHARRGRGEASPADPRLTFERAAEEWRETRFPKISPRTRETYGAGLSHLLGYFRRHRLAGITVSDVARYVSAQEAAGLKGWTIKGHLTVLSGIFRYAARLGFVGTNPVSLLDGAERPNTRDAKPRRVLDPDELGRLLAGVDEPYRLLFELAAETGARLGEVLGLTWGDVDTEASALTFTAQLDRKGERVPLKTERSRRCIEVTRRLSARLAEARLASPRSGPSDLVFLSRLTQRPHDHRNIGGRVLARAVGRAGLDGDASPTFHCLRHSHASALIAQGWDPESVSARLGHANVAITLGTYVHEFDAASRSDERRDRLAAIYGRGMESTDRSSGQQAAPVVSADVPDLREKLAIRQ